MCQVLQDIDILLDSGSLSELANVLKRLKDLLLEQPNNAEILWRIGKAHHIIADKVEDSEVGKDHISQGKYLFHIFYAHKIL